MCGIAGIVRFDDQPIDRRRAEAMLAHMRHRGPDGEGISEHPRCTLAHARLAIIDALGGAQPMHSPQIVKSGDHGPLHLVFNGEIYNHRELRAKLEKLGHRFSSDHSDTEALLLGYRAYGDQLPKHLRGMFAFAIWDEDQRALFMARDRTGKKPLYVCRRANELTFASLPATIAVGVDGPVEPDPQALLTFLRFGYPFGSSMLKGVDEVPPGHWMTVDINGTTRTERYWRPPPISRTSTSIGAADSVEQVLAEAVAVRLEADVPLGCFLSGGIDSSLIAALAQRWLKEHAAPRLKTFSVTHADAEYDESPHARAVAEHIGSDHTELRADPSDLFGDLQRLMETTGEPTADSGALPSHWLCKAARPHIKAALTGDGGDELFGGYDRYRALALLARHRWWLRAMPRGLIHSPNGRSRRARLRRFLDAAAAGPRPSQQYAGMIGLFSYSQIKALAPDLAPELTPALTADAIDDWPDEPDPVHAAMRWDLAHYLPHELLRKADRASMAVALELRCPMLDTQVVDLAGHLPTPVLMPDGRAKGLLRKLAARHVPASIIDLPKRGFSVPIGRWFRDAHRQTLADHLTGPALDGLGLDSKEVARYLDEHLRSRADHSHRLFALLQLSLWGRWMRDASPSRAHPV
jgi:asparagine synthase (glutamine-hydrolysing)